jgi:hypothetical protein
MFSVHIKGVAFVISVIVVADLATDLALGLIHGPT